MSNQIYSVTFSVLLPTYNRDKLVNRAIKSVLDQTFDDFELIVIDDGSTDETKEIVEKWKDNRIKYIFKENGGQNSALNRGLSEAKGKYIAFIDSDDVWLSEKLEKTLDAYKSDIDVSVVYHWTGIKDCKGVLRLARDDKLEGYCYEKVLKQGYLTSPTFISCKTSCFDRIGLFDLNMDYCQDDDFCFNLCKIFKVKLIREILGVYNTDAVNQLSKQSCIYKGDGIYRLWKKHEADVIELCGKEYMANRLFEAVEFYAKGCEIKRAFIVFDEAKRYNERIGMKAFSIIKDYLYGIAKSLCRK